MSASDANVLQIPQDVLDSARLMVPELKVEMAVYLYAQGRLSIGKARIGRFVVVGVSPVAGLASHLAAL